jgi:HPt (histidine-containing phosphotransfer) domain-containing protein
MLLKRSSYYFEAKLKWNNIRKGTMEETSLRLKRIGIEVDNVIERLGGNELLYLSICQKFIYDPNYLYLKEAISNDDRKAAVNHAHTLKGVACNLGFRRLSVLCKTFMEEIDEAENEIPPQIYQELSDEYERIITILKYEQSALNQS